MNPMNSYAYSFHVNPKYQDAPLLSYFPTESLTSILVLEPQLNQAHLSWSPLQPRPNVPLSVCLSSTVRLLSSLALFLFDPVLRGKFPRVVTSLSRNLTLVSRMRSVFPPQLLLLLQPFSPRRSFGLGSD